MDAWFVDISQAFRLIRRHLAFSCFAILILAGGIGAATAVFTLVQAVLLHALPFAEPDRLVWMYNARTERDRAPFSIPDLDDYARDGRTLDGFATFTNWTANLSGSGDAERLEGTRVSGNFFGIVGSVAMVGRVLEPGDESGSGRVAVLTYRLWQRRFAGDSAVVGRDVLLNGTAYTVVGVLPQGFLFPFRDAEVAVPLRLRDDPRRTDRGANFLRVVARLKRGTRIGQAKADLDTISHRLQRQFPDEDARKTGVNLYPLQAEIVNDYRQILWTVFAAVGVLLLVGCGNLANLLLVRASGRRPELALRVSLGASRASIVRQLVVEAGTLAAIGGLLGVGVAAEAIALWRTFGPMNFPRVSDVAIDGRVLAFAALATLAATIVAGVIPAWLASQDLQGAIGGETRASTGSRRHGRARRAFVVVQIAGSAVLLVCMALVARGFQRLERVESGFTPDHALSIQLSLPPARYGSRETVTRFHDALSVRLAGLPGITSAGAVSLLPLSGLLNTMDIAFPGRPAPPPDEVPQAHFRIASPGYFAAAGIRVIKGREFTAHDTASSQPVAVISRTLAERHWPGEDAVGKRLQIGVPGSPAFEVIGVVSDAKQFTLDGAPTADLYLSLYQMPASQASALTARTYWVVRTQGDPRSLAIAIRNAVHTIDPDVATSSMRTLDEVLSASLAARRMNLRLLEVFGQVAILLVAAGVYGIAAFSAGTRKRELAIRSAFGATGGDLVRGMLRDELGPILAGLAGGLAASLVVARFLDGVLFGIDAWDPPTYAAVGAALLGVSALAGYLPARRAGRVDPVELLRG
jgi:putative ABC transport system permease protein